jgi:hypothetical protein
MDWASIEEKIAQDDQNKWDRKAAGQNLRISGDGRLELANGQGEPDAYSLSEAATAQMCQKLEIPVPYFRRLPDKMKALVANYDLERLDGNSFLLRGKGEWIRAFLSSEYVPYNNAQITETAEELLRLAPVFIKSFVLEESHMFFKIVGEGIGESGLKAGIMIGNSEVGLGSVSVEPFVFRLVCTNDLVVAQEKVFRHAHLHFTAAEFSRRLAEAIGKAFEIASSILDTFLSYVAAALMLRTPGKPAA